MNSNLSEALSKAVNISTSRLVHQKSFADYIQTLQTKLQEDLVRASSNAQNIIFKVVTDVEAAFHRVTGRMAVAGAEVEARYADLNQVSRFGLYNIRG